MSGHHSSNEPRPLKQPLLHEMHIRHEARERFVLLDDYEAYGEGMGPPVYAADISTFDIDFTANTNDPKECERIRSTLERWLSQMRTEEKFSRVTGRSSGYDLKDITARSGESRYYNKRGWRTDSRYVLVPVTMSPPSTLHVKDLTLDMVEKLLKGNLLAANRQVADSFRQASRMEYRGPLMIPLGKFHDGAEEYNPYPDKDAYQRSKLETSRTARVGDFGMLPPGESYAQAVKSLKFGVSRGKIHGREEFARATIFVAVSTLNGMLPSPHPTAAKLLGDGSYENTQEERQRMLKERVGKITEEVLGKGKSLLWSSKDAAAAPGQQTFGKHATRLRREERQRLKTDGTPEWFLDSAAKYTQQSDEDFAFYSQQFLGNQKALEEAGGLGALLEDIASKEPKTDKEREERQLKDTIRDRLKKELAIAEPGVSQAPLSWQDLMFFGVHHQFETYKYSSGNDEPGIKEYTSRNPLIDPPRPIPPSLRRFTSREPVISHTQRLLEAGIPRKSGLGE